MIAVWILFNIGLALAKPSEVPNEEYGAYIFGDVETTEPGLPPVSGFCAITDPDKLWTDNIVYYDLDSDYDTEQIELINLAINDLIYALRIDGQNCIDIQKIDRDDPDAPDNYVFIQKYSGCSSYVGMIGGEQRMSLVDSCVTRHGTIQHEFIHALGFYHEHQREDRESVEVEINWDNIEPGTESNFFEREGANLLGHGYDFGSVMHYSAYAFAVDPDIPTIIVPPDEEIGQRVNVSSADVLDIQTLYGCVSMEKAGLAGKTRADLFKPVKWIDPREK